MFVRLWFACVGVAALTMACTRSPQSSEGFYLPEGDLERGKTAFVEMSCDTCHRIAGTEIASATPRAGLVVVLGGKLALEKTREELLTSIIDPSREIATAYQETGVTAEGESLMHNFNDVMTVQQLIDLVTYLESLYTQD